MINLVPENIHFGLLWRTVLGKELNHLLNPWQFSTVGRGFFISTNFHRFTHPRPIDKIGYQIGVVGIDKIG